MCNVNILFPFRLVVMDEVVANAKEEMAKSGEDVETIRRREELELIKKREEAERKARRGEMDPTHEYTFTILAQVIRNLSWSTKCRG